MEKEYEKIDECLQKNEVTEITEEEAKTLPKKPITHEKDEVVTYE